AVVASLLMVVVSCGVSLSALCGNTLLGMSLLWLFLYGGGYLLELLPSSIPTPDRVLHEMPAILPGEDNTEWNWLLLEGTAAISGVAALIGMIGFSRRDV